ncbi:hypothetical protein ACIHCQ_41155 [Streptomyces sp. NPDC052236]|uniref:hypothetical protein n=1 Tax=Streptomyces sp. NPDC052236 TaxID=3365686 RepID=UPI0037D1448F
MTETNIPNEQQTGEPELSGVDLARVALHQAREAAKPTAPRGGSPPFAGTTAVPRHGAR